MDVNRRIADHEFLHIRGQVVEADAVNGRDADGPGDDVLELLQLAVERLVGLDDLLAVVIQHLAFACEPEFFLAALDQQRLENAFESADLLAHGGLGDAVDLGCLGEAFRFSQIAKHFQTFNLHAAYD